MSSAALIDTPQTKPVAMFGRLFIYLSLPRTCDQGGQNYTDPKLCRPFSCRVGGDRIVQSGVRHPSHWMATPKAHTTMYERIDTV